MATGAVRNGCAVSILLLHAAGGRRPFLSRFLN
jgi:hypothetical protein